MAKTIVHDVVFKNTTPEKVYNLYMDSKLHSLIAGSPSKISKKAGASFNAHNNYITGKNLYLVENELIVQTWRGEGWPEGIPDSIFIIRLEPKGNDVKMQAVHANIPEKEVAGIDKGWYDHYWNPWKQYLAGKTITRAGM